MRKSLESYLPIYEDQHRTVQAHVRISLVREVDKIRKKRKLQWQELITSLLEKFADDLRERPTASAEEKYIPAPAGYREPEQTSMF